MFMSWCNFAFLKKKKRFFIGSVSMTFEKCIQFPKNGHAIVQKMICFEINDS